MKIFVDKILDENIYFSTDYGTAKGIWKGVNRPSEKEYFVELDIESVYDYEDLIVSEIQEYQIRIADEQILLTALLVDYDEDGCATFRFGDFIIEIETNFDERIFDLKNAYVTICVEKLNIYDENL